MNRLIKLELRRTSIKPYNTAVLIIAAGLLGFLYLLVLIPKMDPAESDTNLFAAYDSLTGIINIVAMVIFTVLSAVMYAKVAVEEYSGKRALLLFSYPISRNKIFFTKVGIVFLYTVAVMFVAGLAVYLAFFSMECLFQLCDDALSAEVLLKTLASLLGCSVLAGALGSVSLWFGFRKKSISATIVSAAILAVTVCQIMAAAMGHLIVLWIFVCVGLVCAVLLLSRLSQRITDMEVG